MARYFAFAVEARGKASNHFCAGIYSGLLCHENTHKLVTSIRGSLLQTILDNSAGCDTLSKKLVDLYCSCGKKIGRGRGVIEIRCRNSKRKDKHWGIDVWVLVETVGNKSRIISITPAVTPGIITGITPDFTV